jgi:hypothetical protein
MCSNGSCCGSDASALAIQEATTDACWCVALFSRETIANDTLLSLAPADSHSLQKRTALSTVTRVRILNDPAALEDAMA